MKRRTLARGIAATGMMLLPLVLFGCMQTMKTSQASADAVSICYDPARHKQIDTVAAAQKSCAVHNRDARYAGSGTCGAWRKAIYTCVK